MDKDGKATRGFALLAVALVVLVERPMASRLTARPPRDAPRAKELLACATARSATLAVTIGERGNVTKVVTWDPASAGFPPSFLAAAIKTVPKVLRPPSPPSLVAGFPRQIVERVTLHCIPPGIPAPLPPQRPPSGPIRVGGNIRPPFKWLDVSPVYPQTARDAGVQGTVIVEAIIWTDGSVQDGSGSGQQAVRIRQSVPLLDNAAIYAVRQWRYTPTVLNGVAVPVIMTLKVDFSG
jgi:TonB family protein